MRYRKMILLLLVLCFGISVSLLSAQPAGVQSHSLTPTAELQVQGANKSDLCDAGVGLVAGLSLAGAISPCSIGCFIGAWYVLGAMAAAGC
jgi:hypothetical protein